MHCLSLCCEHCRKTGPSDQSVGLSFDYTESNVQESVLSPVASAAESTPRSIGNAQDDQAGD